MLPVVTLIKEFKYKAIRSSGSGGQHVNKVSTKVELSFLINESLALNEEQKLLVLSKLGHRLTKDSVLILQCGESRSQLKNKNIVTNRALDIIFSALKVPKKRIVTKVPKAVIKKRLKNKRLQSQLKSHRKKPRLDD